MNESNMKFTVQNGIIVDGDKVEFALMTNLAGAEMITVRHKSNFDVALGGVRFVNQGSLVETYRLARGMGEKCLACFVPADGAKTLVITPAGIPDEKTRASLLAVHIRNCTKIDPTLIFGPDMGSPEEVMALTLEASDKMYRNVTGLPKRLGGLDIDANGFTAHGVSESIQAARRNFNIGNRVIIQGYGAVGTITSKLLNELGFKVVGVSNINGSLYDPKGLDVVQLLGHYHAHGDQCLNHYQSDAKCVFSRQSSDLLGVPADIFVPAARTSILSLRSEIEEISCENPDVLAIETFLSSTGVKLIVQAANHPLTYRAEEFAAQQGVICLPDFIVNCGGMIGCFVEWKYRNDLLKGIKSYNEVVTRCNLLIEKIIKKNMNTLLSKNDLNMRAIANSLIDINLSNVKMGYETLNLN